LISWGLGIGDCGLVIGDWGQSPILNPQSPKFQNKFKKYLKNIIIISIFICFEVKFV